MELIEQQQIRERTGALVLDWAADQQPPFTGESPDGFTEALLVASLVADEGRLGLHRWVAAARRAGLSWTDIGKALGISKQAAQQRFGAALLEEDTVRAGMIVRNGATAFNEMRILEEEGRLGNELVGTGLLELTFRRTDHVWEYCRRFGLKPEVETMATAGWTYVSSWLPFHYFKRALPEA